MSVTKKRIEQLYHSKISSCNSRRIPFFLTFEQFSKLILTEKCAYTGVQLTVKPYGPKFLQSQTDVTLERIDCDKGYTVENTIAVCYAANNAKSSFECYYRGNAAEMMKRMVISLEKIKRVKYTTMQKIICWVAGKFGLTVV